MNFTKDEKTIKILRPHWTASWYLYLGILLGPAIIFFERDPEGAVGKWVTLSLIFLALLLHRLGLKYTLTNKRVVAQSWWGLGREDRIHWANLTEPHLNVGFTTRLAGCGHIWLGSLSDEERSINLLGQKRPEELIEEIKCLAASQATAGI